MPDKLVILTGSDGKSATVTIAAATQASIMLRDLLDGLEPTTTVLLGSPAGNSVTNNPYTHEDEANTINNGGTPAIEVPFPYFTGDLLKRICAHMTYRYDYRPPTQRATGDSSVTRHPAESSSGATNAWGGLPGRNVMRTIPRPMVLPLSEYLDAYDRHFIEDWDETTTVLMVKAATLLNYDELLNLSSARLAVILSEKPVEGIRAFLGVEGDFTPEEEAELKKEHDRGGQ